MTTPLRHGLLRAADAAVVALSALLPPTRVLSVLALLALPQAVLPQAAFAQDAAERPVRVRHYDLDVTVHPTKLEIAAVLQLEPGTTRLQLALAPAMRVAAARTTEDAVEHTREGSRLVLTVPKTAQRIEIDVEGTPHNQFGRSRGGFLRTTVNADITYIRNQYPWYPRVDGGLATYRTVVRAPADWLVRTAGSEQRADDGAWTFTQGTPIRRVGLTAGPYVRRKLDIEGGFVLDALVFPGDEEGADRLLGITHEAFLHYSARFGGVTMKRFSIVEMPAAFGPGSGYSEAGYMLLGNGAFGGGGSANALAAHEVAHTWWAGEVSFREFASESLASYATLGWVESASGAASALQLRKKAIDAVCDSASAGREVALGDIRGFGAGMDPRTYRVHAYEKGMLILQMAEDALGREKMDALLARFAEHYRGEVVGWPELRKALSTGRAKDLVKQWETPGIPRLTLEHDATRSRNAWKVKGTIAQEGTKKPYRMSVVVQARAGDEVERTTVELKGRTAKFSLSLKGEPESVVLDPDWRLLVRAPRGRPLDPKKVVDEAARVFNSPNDRDTGRNEATISQLKALLASGAGSREGLCHTGIGRCCFRLGRFDEAREHFAQAMRLGPGGPFHARWIELRLGCMADADGKREAALVHYRKVIASGKKGSSTDLARRFLETPYRSP